MSNPFLYGDIQIQECETIMIQKLKVDQEWNRHSNLFVSGIVNEEDLKHYEGNLFLNDSIHIRGKGILIFSGIITNKTIKCLDGIHYLEITALSHTYQMDIEPKCRSFQKVGMKYSEIIEEILASYPEASFLNDSVKDKAIGKLLIKTPQVWRILRGFCV